MNTKVHDLIIIGSGPAGLTAAVYAARANLHPIIIEGKTPGGQLMSTTYVENWPGQKSILGPMLMMQMREHALHFGTNILSESVVTVDFAKKPFSVTTDAAKTYHAQSIIIATGAHHKTLGCPGEATYWSKGVTTCAVCDGAFYPNKKVVVIGGGDTAMEDASFLKKFTNQITIVHILDKLTASFAMQQRVLGDPDIKIIYESTVKQFHGNGTQLTGMTIRHQKTGNESELEADGAFIAIGLKPNTAPFKGQLAMNELGYITVTNQVHTSVPGIFAAGDVHDYKYRQAITSAGAGCMAALEAERYLLGL
ncbi:thioredoxin-disulfide reductase [bacterium]|nr:MAG: thioredoxin-disulfide reductase [bacterium]QQR61714.1 MAG: thioredoxin-disulfide reductase [bacterium]QQR62718.1 MAG: thioredoxin-disulfide reductase [bacterium]